MSHVTPSSSVVVFFTLTTLIEVDYRLINPAGINLVRDIRLIRFGFTMNFEVSSIQFLWHEHTV